MYSFKDWCIDNHQEQMLTEFINGQNDISPDQISYGSTQKVYWKCSLGHCWQSSLNNRTNHKNGCPICGNKKVLVGFNDLATTQPDVAAEWNYDKNGVLKPTDIVANSNKNIWWKCQKGHEYQQRVVVRTQQHTGCPVCANIKLLTGYNDLATTHPHLAEEWDFDKNSKTPYDVIAGTHEKAHWRCSKNHTWKASIVSRTYGGHGCPYCNNQKAWPEYNDLESNYPELAAQWDYKHNEDITPQNVVVHSNKSFYWICDNGHSYQATVSDRLRGRGCPYCAGRKVLVGFNDLASKRPDLVRQWHPTKNGDLRPTDVTCGCDKKVFWICSKNHIWSAVISSRVASSGCPICAQSKQTSLGEKTIAFYVKKHFPDTECNVKFNWSERMEADVYIPSESIAVEYDGRKWHKNIAKDEKKDKLFFEHEIKLIRIREEGCPTYNNKYSIHISTKEPHGNISILKEPIKELFSYLGLSIELNIDNDYSEILTSFVKSDCERPFFEIAPHLKDEWDYAKNGNLDPNAFSFGSQKKVWWKCKDHHHSWQAVISSRVKGSQCPYCTGRYVLPGFNDFATIHPELLEQWDYDKNDILPSQVLHSSNKQVFWKCDKGHSWKTMISTRLNGNNCPYCSNQKILTGYNDLATTHPELIQEWDFNKNTLLPTEICAGTEKKAWWKCQHGHSYQALISSRAKQKTGCPICAQNKRKHPDKQ